MIEIIHSFGCGIAFAVGVTVGVLLCRAATRDGRKEMGEEWKASQARIEARLTGSLKCHERIALSLEAMNSVRDKANDQTLPKGT